MLFIKRNHDQDDITTQKQEDTTQKIEGDVFSSNVIHSDATYAKQIRSEIRDHHGSNFIDSEGIKTSLSGVIDVNIPLLEILCMCRDLEGEVHPAEVNSLYIVEPGYGTNHEVNGTAFRTIIGKDSQYNWPRLECGFQYQVTASYRDESKKIIWATQSIANFSIPKELDAGDIYRVELIVIDKIKEYKAIEQAMTAKEERTRIEKEETITLQFSRFPDQKEQGAWLMEYYVGNESGSFRQIEDNTYFKKGPNKLGGDLIVYYNYDYYFSPWLYISNVQKRTLQLPADASIVIQEDEMISATVSLSQIDPNILSQYKMVGFFSSEDAKLPLFLILLVPEIMKKWQADDWQVDMKIRPGTYFTKLFTDEETQLDMGVIYFTKEPGKTYTLSVK